jgi:hypothetical protein
VLICAPLSLPVQLLPPLAEKTQALQLQQRNTGRNALAPGPHDPNSNDLWLDVYSANALSRVGGLGRRLQPVPCKLVVDVREFMSGLPAVLHQQGFRLTPITLEVRYMCYFECYFKCYFMCCLCSVFKRAPAPAGLQLTPIIVVRYMCCLCVDSSVSLMLVHHAQSCAFFWYFVCRLATTC